jgi:hypothetical protein
VADGQFTWENGFDNLRAKIGRAYKHLKEFDSLVVSYCRSEPYTITKHDDLVNQRHVVRCEFSALDADIHLSLAEVIYSLRSGLDQLAWQLALLRNPNPSRDVMFPIHSDQSSKAEERFRRLVWDMPCDAVTVIRDLQPYKREAAYRDDPLWQLNELSNIDKHRVPAGRATIGSFYLEPKGWIRHDFDYGVEFSWPLSVKDTVVFKPDFPTLVFGDPINNTSRIPLELTREDIARVYNYVRQNVAPRFTHFFSAPAYPEIL